MASQHSPPKDKTATPRTSSAVFSVPLHIGIRTDKRWGSVQMEEAWEREPCHSFCTVNQGYAGLIVRR